MITLHASANDIERALHELQHLAANGEGSDARHTGEFLLALYAGDENPLNLQDFANLCPSRMHQALQLLAFLMTTGTSLDRFISEEAIDQVKDNLSAIRCEGFLPASIAKRPERNPPPPTGRRPKPPPSPPPRLSSCPLLPPITRNGE